MRTNIDIDDELMREAMEALGAKTKKEAVELALRKAVRIGRQRSVLELRGTVDWVGNLDEMRRDA